MSSTPTSTSTNVSTTSSALPAPTNKGGKSSNLYLFTFLATLFLLLAISFAIVLRSMILRRRFRLRVQEALDAGAVLDPRGRWALGEKPGVYEVWVGGGAAVKGMDVDAGKGVYDEYDGKWDTLQPVAVQPYTAHDSSQSALDAPPVAPRSLFGLGRARHPPPVLPPPINAPAPDNELQISVLIAMPTPNPHVARDINDEEEEEVPYLEFGVARVKTSVGV